MTKTKKAIIIGSGIGGLTCAVELARKGFAVTVLEKNSFPGGYCGSYKKEGCTFDFGPHFLTAGGQRNNIMGNFFASLPIKVKFIKLNYFDHFFLGKKSYKNPTNFKKYLRQLQHKFPTEKNNLIDFFVEIKKIALYYQSPEQEKYTYITFQEMLNSYFKNKELKNLLAIFARYQGLQADEALAINSAAFLGSVLYFGAFYPKGGMGRLAETLVKNLEHYRGKIIYHAPVTSILVKNNMVTGVKYKTFTGKQSTFLADLVVSNADINYTFGQLLSTKKLPPLWQKKLAQVKPGFSGVVLNLTTKKLTIAEKQKAGLYTTNSSQKLTPKTFILICPTIHDKTLATPDKATIRLLAFLTKESADIISKTSQEKIKKHYLKIIFTLMPNLKNRISNADLLFPKSYEKLTNNSGGAFFGSIQNQGKNNPAGETHLPNLYLAGHWAHGMAGVQGAFVSGLLCARKIIARS